MNDLPNGLAEKVDALLKEHGVGELNKADVLGQVAALVEGCCAANTVEWMNGGLAYRHAVKTGAVGLLKRLHNALSKEKESHVNYNDMDCDLRSAYFKIPRECLECSSIVARIEDKTGERKAPKTADCPRCKGTGLDPEFFDEAWVVQWSNHGYETFYAVIESYGRVELHVRNLPYNTKRADSGKNYRELCEAVQHDQYDTDCKLLRYRDPRDSGFILSLSYDKATPNWDDPSHNCEASLRAIRAIDDVAEHFICVIESLEKGEEP